MQRRSATNELIVEASHVIHRTVGVLPDLEFGGAKYAVGAANSRVNL